MRGVTLDEEPLMILGFFKEYVSIDSLEYSAKIIPFVFNGTTH